jgi:hypothetical protein
MKRLGVGACVGTAVGFLGWLIGLAAVCIGTGELAILEQVALPGLALSLGAAGLVIVTLGLAPGAIGRGRVFRLLLWGEILFFVGLLILLVNHWIAPLVDAAPDLKRAIERLGSVYRTGDALPTALMAAGTALFALVLRRVGRSA